MEEIKVVSKFNDFIKKWCGNNYPHLIDSDENDGEAFRKELRKLTQESDNLKRNIEETTKENCLLKQEHIPISEIETLLDVEKVEKRSCVDCKRLDQLEKRVMCYYLPTGNNISRLKKEITHLKFTLIEREKEIKELREYKRPYEDKS